MLDALDESIKAILRDMGGLDADEVDIAFEAPDREWSARVGKPTVNCYLYDIRENLELRGTEWSVEREPNGRTAARRKAPRRFDLSYVCTAWTADVEDEHRLLWRVLGTFLRCGELPRRLLKGELLQIAYPLPTRVAQPDGLLRDPADVWSALDNRIRPSVNLVVTLPLEEMDPVKAPLVLTRRIRVDEFGRSAELLQIGGTIRGEDGQPVKGAVVRLKGRAFATEANEAGRFRLAGMPAGEYTLLAEFDGTTAERAITIPGADYDLVTGDVPAPPKRAGKGEKAGKGDSRRPP